MFNAASKTAFTAGAVAVAAGFAAVFATTDRVAFSALVFAGVMAVAVGLAGFYFAPRDPVVPVSAEVEAATVRVVDAGDLPRPSLWPFVGAVSVALLAVGAATGKSLIVIGLIVAVVAAFAWLGQVWREHPSWTQAMTDRVNDRFVVPIGLPGTIIVLAGLGAVSLSRLFLAVSKEAAPIIGIVLAFILLGVFYLVSTRERLERSLVTTLVAIGAVLVLAAGVGGALMGEREFHRAGEAHGGGVISGDVPLTLGADGFDTLELDLPAGADAVIEFHNETDTAQTLVFTTDEDGEGDVLAELADVAPGATAKLKFATPAPGTYYFHAGDEHGTLIVTEDASVRDGTEH